MKVLRGQVWALGRHRLMCGDAANPNDIAKLFLSDIPTLVITSPPYADARAYNDPIECWDKLMKESFLRPNLSPDVQILVNLGPIHRKGEWVPYWNDWLNDMRRAKWQICSQYIWDKTYGLPGKFRGRLQPAHEYIFHINKQVIELNKHMTCYSGRTSKCQSALRYKDGKKENSKPKLIGILKNMDSVIRCGAARFGEATGHPAQMPLALASLLIKSFSNTQTVTYDPFCGAATTIIACEEQGVMSLGMEISAQYISLAIQRWNERYPHALAKKVA